MFSAALPQADRKPGGVDIYISRLSDHLQAAGHAVSVYSYSPAPPGASFDHVRLRPHRFANSALARMTIVPWLLNRCEFNGDVLHLHSDDWFLTRRALPTVRTFHGSALYEALFASRWRRRLTQAAIVPLEMRAARLANARFAVAPGTETWLGLDGHLPSGIERPAGDPTPAESPTILFVGTWAGRKRGAFLHRVFTEEVRSRIPNAELWMVSDHCVETAGVRWLERPSDEELAELYSRAWVLAAPSLYEGFGVYYLEAMVSETMVIATPNPGSTYVLDQGRAGLLVEDDAFGRAIADALESPEMRGGYVARGRQRAEDFSWARAVEDHVHAYELAIERWSRGVRGGRPA
jgi:phosphatidylinositol alpha-mannosyltransferase